MSQPPPIPPQPKPSVAQAYVLFIVAMALVIVVGAPLQLWSMPVGVAITELALILLPAVLYARLKRAPVAASLGWKPVAPTLALRAVVIGASAWGMAILLYEATSLALKPLLGADPTSAALRPLVPETWPGVALTFLVAAVLPGLCEESLFRGAIQGTLESKGLRKAVVIAAALFAVFHLNPWNLVPAFALGLVLGTLAARTGSTLPAMIAHACGNAMAFGLPFVLHDSTKARASWLVVILAGVFVLAFAEFLRRTRRIERTPSPLARPREEGQSLPPGATPRAKHAAIWIAVAVVVALVALILAARTVFVSYRMTTDELTPEIQRGDMVLMLKARWIRDELKPGDLVAFKHNGPVIMRKVARADAMTVWVSLKDWDGSLLEIAVPRRDILGRMIFKVSLGKMKE